MSGRKKPESADKRTYILQLVNGSQRRITIPAQWKLTFGNVLPYNKVDYSAGPNPGPYLPPDQGWQSRVVLRVYDGAKENLRACWNDVVSFHSTDMEIEVTAVEPVVKTKTVKSQTGMVDVTITQASKSVWLPVGTEK